MSTTMDLTDQDVFTALVSFFGTFLPTGTPVVQGQENLVSMPPEGFVVMTNAGLDRLSFNVDNYFSDTQLKTILTPTRYTIQLDFYGHLSSQWVMETIALFRDEYSTEMFPANIQPLYADNAIQIPLINGAERYEQRWSLKANLQYNPIITTDQQSALEININPLPIDQTFLP
jgi:hypothetical protein